MKQASAYDDWESVEDGWIECCGTMPGSIPPSVPFYMANTNFFMRDRCLATAALPIPITGVSMQIRGYTGPIGGLGGIVLDKGKRFIAQTGYPLGQNGDFSTNQHNLLCDALSVDGSGTRILRAKWPVNSAPLYVPGEDALYRDLVFAGASPLPIQIFHQIRFLVPQGMSEGWPESLLTATTGGNDANTVLLIHGAGPDGSVAFQDNSFRNYTMRWVGGVRLKGGKVVFDGTGLLCPDMAPPGYEFTASPSVLDWNIGLTDFTLDMLVMPTTSTPATEGVIASMGDGRCPFQVCQEPTGIYSFFAASAGGTGFDIANKVSMGPAVAGTETRLAVVRSGAHYLLYNGSGPPVATLPIPASGLANSLSSSTGSGRPTFGAQSVMDMNGNVTGTPYFWAGALREIRFSNVARWTSNLTPPTLPYTP